VSERGSNGLVERIAHELKRSIKIDPSFDASVMAEVRRQRQVSVGLKLLNWWRRPRQMSLSPLGMAAVGAVAVVAVIASPLQFGDGDATQLSIAADKPASVIRFVLDAPRASSVHLSGDFNDWDLFSTPMVRGTSGEWETTVRLVPGRYKYTFVVDGDQWVPDPSAPPALFDDFGGAGSTITVPEV
jgi:hypothetical protein